MPSISVSLSMVHFSAYPRFYHQRCPLPSKLLLPIYSRQVRFTTLALAVLSVLHPVEACDEIRASDITMNAISFNILFGEIENCYII